MSNNSSTDTIKTLISTWKKERTNSQFDPATILNLIAEVVEVEKNDYLKLDNDPFDDRKPDLSDTHGFAQVLSCIVNEEQFLEDLSEKYIVSSEDGGPVVEASARLICSLFSVIRMNFSLESDRRLVDYLFKWAESSDSPLNAYSLCILGYLLQQPDVVHATRAKSVILIPVVIEQLKYYCAQMIEENVMNSEMEESNSNWSGVCMGTYSLSPLSNSMSQRLTIVYLKELAEYQDMMPLMYNNGILELIYQYMDLKVNRDVRLAFEGLHLLSCLLCHHCVYMCFVENAGIEKLIKVPRPSVAATAVSVCLYFVSYFDDAMERVCQRNPDVIKEMTDYALWLLECSHESARCYTLYFFHSALNYGCIMSLFEQKGGLRYLYNAISTRLLLNSHMNGTDNDSAHLATSWQIVRIGLAAIKKYMELNVLLWAERLSGTTPLPFIDESPSLIVKAGSRALKFNSEQLSAMIEFVAEHAGTESWPPAEEFDRLGGIDLIYRILVINTTEYEGWPGRTECIKLSVDILHCCCLPSRLMMTVLLHRVRARHLAGLDDDGDNSFMDGLQGLLLLLNNEECMEPVVQKSILSLLCTCVCRRVNSDDDDENKEVEVKKTQQLSDATSRKRKYHEISGNHCDDLDNSSDVPYLPPPIVPPISRQQSEENNLSQAIPSTVQGRTRKVWRLIRRYNGIMILLTLLKTKTPIADADMIRMMSCKALVGLARDDDVKNMLAKMPICTKGHLQLLMKEPVLADKMHEHALFCRLSTSLLHTVVGNTSEGVAAIAGGDISMERIRKAEIVANTKIQWDASELLELVYRHLQSSGLHESASALLKEANLKLQSTNAPPVPNLSQFSLYDTPAKIPRSGLTVTPILQTNGTVMDTSNLNDTICSQPDTPLFTGISTPGRPKILPNSAMTTSLLPTSTLKLNKTNRPGMTPATTPHRNCLTARDKLAIQNQYMKPGNSIPQSNICSLNQIVEAYLKHQHAMCPNPLSVCPKFSLTQKHQCPDIRPGGIANMTKRVNVRQYFGYSQSRTGYKEDRRFYYSRFFPAAIVPEFDRDVISSCCYSRTPVTDSMFLGFDSGTVGIINHDEDSPTFLATCHTTSIRHLENSKDASLLLTCSLFSSPRSALWKVSSPHQPILTFGEDNYGEFSKLYQDKVVTTLERQAFVYDLETGAKLSTLTSDTQYNNYKRNKGTFSYDDMLVLNDGVLWDVRCSGGIRQDGPIHKFDKFQSEVSGVFHPNQMDVIIGSAVWDLRTYRLLHMVNALDQMECRFNATGDIIYAGVFQWDEDDNSTTMDDPDNSLKQVFRTLDALDYSLISTVNIKKEIKCLALDEKNITLCLIEAAQSSISQSNEDSHCRLYTIGRKRSTAEEEEEEETQAEDEDEDEDEEDLSDVEDEFEFEIIDSDNVDDNENGDDNADTDGDDDDNDGEDDVDDEEDGDEDINSSDISESDEDIIGDELDFLDIPDDSFYLSDTSNSDSNA